MVILMVATNNIKRPSFTKTSNKSLFNSYVVLILQLDSFDRTLSFNLLWPLADVVIFYDEIRLMSN